MPTSPQTLNISSSKKRSMLRGGRSRSQHAALAKGKHSQHTPTKTKVHPSVERAKHIESESRLLVKILFWFLQSRATVLLVLANVIVYFFSLTWSPSLYKSLIFTPESLYQLDLVPMISSWFIHADLTHLIGNMLFLFIFGRIVERKFGFARFLLIYFSSALISDLVTGLIFDQGGIGASGAIAGLIAAGVIIRPFYITYALGFPLPVVLVGWLALIADLSGVIRPVPEDTIGHIAHLAGFFGISVLIYLVARSDEQVKRGFFVNIATGIILGVLFWALPDNPLRAFLPY